MKQETSVRNFKEDTRTIYTPQNQMPTTNQEPTTPIKNVDNINLKNPEENINKTPPNKTADQINNNIPNKTIDQISTDSNCQSILSVWQRLFPTLPESLGQLSSYTPPNLSNKNYNANFTQLSTTQIARLIRTIYLKVLRSIDTYSLLIRTTQNKEQSIFVNLRTQMQVLSAVILNIYGDYTRGNFVPLRVDINSFLPKDKNQAILYLYNEIYCIYYLTQQLIFNFDATSPFYNQILAFINNIKYQLNTIYNFININ